MNLLTENSVRLYNNTPVCTQRKSILPEFKKKELTESEKQNNILKKRTKIAWGYIASIFIAVNIMHFAIKASTEGVNIFKEIPKTITAKRNRFAMTKKGIELLEKYEKDLKTYPEKSFKYKMTKLSKRILFGPDGGPAKVVLYTMKEFDDVLKGILPYPDQC